ncbi:MAG: hypothetical protein HY903_20125 [Deltaproteobacteria bacterium]|nr:hypothetical protein [Deltaproteobacteria bacterium]
MTAKGVSSSLPSAPVLIERQTPAAAPTLEAPKDGVKLGEVGAPLPPLAPSVPTFDHLKLELAGLQLRLIDAERYLADALPNAPLVVTDVAAETLAAGVVQSLRTGGSLDAATATALVAQAVATGGARSLAFVSVALEARLAALLQASTGGAPAALEARAAATLNSFATAGLSYLATNGPKTPDAQAALASMQAANEVLSAGCENQSLFPTGTYDRDFHAFTNEPGLNRALTTLGRRGGAVVGASGGILDVGSTLGADLIISVDIDPLLHDALQVFVGVLLVVDRQCRENGWDDQRRAAEVSLRLASARPATLGQTVAELTAAGLPAPLVKKLPRLLAVLGQRLGDAPGDIWCKGPDAPARIAHLTRLALEGRILAVTADLADPRIIDRVGTLCAAHGSPVAAVNLSNVLDYVPNTPGVAVAVKGLPRRPDAVVLTTSSHLSWIEDPTASDAATLARLGTFESPAVHPASVWADSSLAHDIQAAGWRYADYRDKAWKFACSLVAGSMRPKEAESIPVPQSPAALVAAERQLATAVFAEPASARARLRLHLEQRGEWAAYLRVGAEPDKVLAALSPPRGLGDIDTLAARLDRQVWAAPERRRIFLEAELERQGVAPADTEGFAAAIAAARSWEDLVSQCHLLVAEVDRKLARMPEAERLDIAKRLLEHAYDTRIDQLSSRGEEAFLSAVSRAATLGDLHYAAALAKRDAEYD